MQRLGEVTVFVVKCHRHSTHAIVKGSRGAENMCLRCAMGPERIENLIVGEGRAGEAGVSSVNQPYDSNARPSRQRQGLYRFSRVPSLPGLCCRLVLQSSNPRHTRPAPHTDANSAWSEPSSTLPVSQRPSQLRSVTCDQYSPDHEQHASHRESQCELPQPRNGAQQEQEAEQEAHARARQTGQEAQEPLPPREGEVGFFLI